MRSAPTATLKAADPFPGELVQGSNVLPLSVAQKTVETVAASGNYRGVVSVIVTQGAASGG
ncbi:conserved hypothetical protein [Burkholderia diffusa]|uniref:CS1 type fimbrial major subunit n=1 Tax=Burkholderia diffusa TaxID=488732 RepID=UPI001CB2307B|nr:CS1 type fimbrial major subunit [Burkholderia diffusa]CAG9246576.1 conserved hypothetical protein [Burkholderia diffusa]